jgi:twitching motility protein PilT
MEIMGPDQQAQYRNEQASDFSFEVEGLARFRVNVFAQSRGIAAAFRRIPTQIPALSALQAPAILSTLMKSTKGLILVTGPTGSGKSTTLAAMIDQLNQTESRHVLTLEDPIEFVHPSKQCLMHQREIGLQALSFESALRSALRQDPDVILVGELRDLATIRLALTAAETGHLVLGTLHTSGAAKTMDRIVDVFPAEEKGMVRSMLSESLNAVVSQILLKRKEGGGRVAAHEILVATPAIRHLIREGKVAQLYSAIQTGGAAGMQTLDQSLSALAEQGLIDWSVAKAQANYPEHLARA